MIESLRAHFRVLASASLAVAVFFVIGSFIKPEGVKAFTALLGTPIWPAVILVALFWFRPEFVKIAGRVTEFDVLGVKAKLGSEFAQAEKEVEQNTGPAKAPTTAQIKRATEVEQILSSDPKSIMVQVDKLVDEYETTRSTMTSSNERTRLMSRTVAKMRIIALAAFPYRYELAKSVSQGRRLQAIICLQVKADYDMLDWLADRISLEVPFLQYHALLALKVAATSSVAKLYRVALEQALNKVKAGETRLQDAQDRVAMLREFERCVQNLSSP